MTLWYSLFFQEAYLQGISASRLETIPFPPTPIAPVIHPPARSLMTRSGGGRVAVEIRGAVGAGMVAVDIHVIVFHVGAS